MKAITEKSIFVSANAGSGKTYALVMRVLGLLLEGAQASKILCITYTNAGAMEMKERLKKQMLAWHNATEPEYMGEKLIGERAQTAKGLYLEALKTGKFPKICTFHGFCMEVTRAFNVEAGAPYTFELLSDVLVRKIKRNLAEHIMEDPAIRQKTAELSGFFTVNQLAEDVIGKITDSRDVLADILASCEGEYTAPYAALDIPYKPQKLAEILRDLQSEAMQKLQLQHAIGLLSGMQLGVNDSKFLRKLCGDFNDIAGAFITNDGEVRKSAITKKLKEKHPYLEEFEAESSAVLGRYTALKSKYISAKVSQIIVEIARVILRGYEAKKRELMSFDFDDLIDLAEGALKGESRDFILFKLDGGISHILVDEAQDTNAKQWGILASILEEFFSGGAAEPKTLFVVGDYKQSIYSFQGAQVEVFNDVYRRYKANLERVEMRTSYRSSASILRFIDEVFAEVEGFDSAHTSALKADYCHVEVMDLPEAPNKAEDSAEVWQMPWEETEEGGIHDAMAAQICAKVRDVLAKGYLASDIMMLTKSRDLGLISKLKKRLNEAGIGLIFNDEIAYGESLPLCDIISYLKFLALPLDEYARACVLRSPFYGLSEREIEEICKGVRPAPEISQFPTDDLERLCFAIYSHFLPRYAEFERREAAVIFNLLREYQVFAKAPTLSGFLRFIDGCKEEKFKLSLESSAENSVKLGTVHGAKGLESAVVFLLNATEGVNRAEKQENLIIGRFGAGEIALFGGGEGKTPLFSALKEAKLDAAYREYLRLFYVALTRAKEEIYIFGKKPSAKPDSWYDLAKDALFRLCGGAVFKAGVLPERMRDSKESAAEVIVIDDVYAEISQPKGSAQPEGNQKPEGNQQPEGGRHPEGNSQPEAASVIQSEPKTGESSRGAKYGEAVHILLQAGVENTENAEAFLALRFAEFSPEERRNLVAVAMRNMREHQALLSRGMAEVSLGKFRLDRLILEGEEAIIVDYKFYREEAISAEISAQLRGYKKVVEEVCKLAPQNIKTQILWLNSAVLEEVEI